MESFILIIICSAQLSLAISSFIDIDNETKRDEISYFLLGEKKV